MYMRIEGEDVVVHETVPPAADPGTFCQIDHRPRELLPLLQTGMVKFMP